MILVISIVLGDNSANTNLHLCATTSFGPKLPSKCRPYCKFALSILEHGCRISNLLHSYGANDIDLGLVVHCASFSRLRTL